MPKVTVNGVSIFYEVTGTGFPLVWSHELAGDYRSWDAQVGYFSRRYQVITYNDRGYPPSDVPVGDAHYSQEQSVEDLHRLLLHLGVRQAYVGGLSMGGSVALAYGLAHPEMCRALILAGAGTGSTNPERFARETSELAARLEREGTAKWGEEYAEGPTRVQFKRKDPKGWERFRDSLAAHSAQGKAYTVRNVQGKRPPIFAWEERLRQLDVPALIIIGDEDEPCIEPSIFLKRRIPRSGLVVLPQSGHTVNLEEPALFNQVVSEFLSAVEAGKWAARDAGSGVGFLAGEGR
ncbi:MAG: alpha/beta fold hydrolase [Chloroflexi bacterium]|nr:alpha/beta fold hydrolase [Chloroflexota bacterium]